METLKFLLAQFIFDNYLFHKATHKYTKFDWFLNRWCVKTFDNFYAKKVKEKTRVWKF